MQAKILRVTKEAPELGGQRPSDSLKILYSKICRNFAHAKLSGNVTHLLLPNTWYMDMRLKDCKVQRYKGYLVSL